MIKKIDGVLLFSENGKKLADFYTNMVDLKPYDEYEMGDDGSVYMFTLGKNMSSFTIMNHKKVKGVNENPERFMVNFEVDDIESEFGKLVKKGVKKIQDIYHIESYGKVATFEDIDGNFFQIVQVRAN